MTVTFEQGKDQIAELAEHFRTNQATYSAYKEADARQSLIDPLFMALGWDVRNESHTAPQYREVIPEESLEVEGHRRAPDYTFRVGQTPKFYAEAKRAGVNVKDDPGPAYQLRRYSWSAKLPFSILTSFAQLAVYDCRMRPAESDKASKGRTAFYTCEEYADRWRELWDVFSREAVWSGSFDQFIQSQRGKRGTSEVDSEFLKEIEGWRDLLARNIALRNPGVSQRDLNVAVQRTIDRIVFLRICEDRAIEPYGTLQALTNSGAIYARLGELFHKADGRYNSGLFYFTAERDRGEPPDETTLALAIDDKPLKDILKSLYFPESPYEFSVLPAEILGQVYEQFLGKVIRLMKGGQAKVDEKPEVRKAGGVYYTPAYIVDYIVQNTVGKLLEGKTPKEAARLRIVDPACGSGSFLIGAYRFLLDWHRDWYVKEDPRRLARGRAPVIYQGAGGHWRLTISEKKRILLNNIYGVDIDSQAVEVTKLSLLLKVLEGESSETISAQLRLFHERALPDLAANIKCGNSLIGPDFYNGRQLSLLDDEEQWRINVFDWKAEFPAVFKAGGFDAVIGNPPYVRQESLSEFKDYFEKRYEAFDGIADLYAYFMEKGLKLLRDGGLLNIIVSSSFMRATYGEPLRRMLKKHAAVLRIVDFGGLAVFSNAKDTYVCIPLLAKGVKQQKQVEVSKVDSVEIRNVAEHVAANHFAVPHERLSPEAWSLKSNDEAAVFAKVAKAGMPLGEYVERKFFRGLLTGLNEAFKLSADERGAIVKSSPKSNAVIKRFLGGQDIRRFYVNDDGRYLIVIPSGWTRQEMAKAKKGSADFSEREAWKWLSREYPKLAEHLAPFADALRKRRDQGDYWWELRSCDYYAYLDSPKIIFPDICKGPRFCLDRTGIYLANTAYCLGTDSLYLLGVLNSRLFWFAISNISIPFGIRAGQYRYRLIYQYMEKVPIRPINMSVRSDKSRHDRMVELVETMLGLHKKFAAARGSGQQTLIQRQIHATDRQIDQLVYELYGLTDEEIAILERSSESDLRKVEEETADEL